jgi:hypothetical protein
MNIWVPKIKIAETRDPMVGPGGRVSGFFKIVARRDDGLERVIADWQPNLITDYGLNIWGTTKPIQYCAVSSDSRAPAVGDTQLYGSPIYTHSSVVSSGTGAQGSAPYYGWYKATFRFNSFTGTNRILSEVGFGTTSGGVNLWSRALIKNSGGIPQSVTWIAGETLDVYYEVRKYMWLTDVPYEDVIGGATYTGVVRAAMINDSSQSDGAPAGFVNVASFMPSVSTTYLPAGHTGAIGAITSVPGGSPIYSGSNGGASLSAYVNNSLKRTGSFTLNASSAATLLSWRVSTSVCAYQKSISPAFVKSVDFVLVINFESGTWGRYVP